MSEPDYMWLYFNSSCIITIYEQWTLHSLGNWYNSAKPEEASDKLGSFPLSTITRECGNRTFKTGHDHFLQNPFIRVEDT
jgi:hypothetical protein